jgi:hypothetical protein
MIITIIIMSIDIKAIEQESVDWIDVAQDRDKWRDFVNNVMNFQVSYNARNFSTS